MTLGWKIRDTRGTTRAVDREQSGKDEGEKKVRMQEEDLRHGQLT
jgi:hypothetical protein